MKRYIKRLILLIALACPAALLASPIAIGTFSYVYSDSVGQPGFSVVNLTGAGASCVGAVTGPGTNCYPSLTELTFTQVSLSVTYAVNGVQQPVLTVSPPDSDSGWFAPSYNYCGTFGVDANCGDPAYPFHVPGTAAIAGGDVTVLSATLSGSLSPVQFSLTDGTTFTSDGTFSATLHPFTDCAGNADYFGNPTSDCYGESVDLVTNAAGGALTPVPEPSSGYLLLGGVAVLAWDWRRRRDCVGT